jgi:hypothetical protein
MKFYKLYNGDRYNLQHRIISIILALVQIEMHGKIENSNDWLVSTH